MYNIMIKIDQKDLRILYELDLNCRQSFSKIGKKTGLTKSSVAYRVQRLEQEGIIKNYYTFIDGIGLGYIVLRLYLIFQYTTKETEEEIIKFCEGKIAGYKKPKSVDFMESLPKSPAGKILKRVLRELYWKEETFRIS